MGLLLAETPSSRGCTGFRPNRKGTERVKWRNRDVVYSSFSDRVDGYGLDIDLALAFLWSVVFLFPLPTETVFFWSTLM